MDVSIVVGAARIGRCGLLQLYVLCGFLCTVNFVVSSSTFAFFYSSADLIFLLFNILLLLLAFPFTTIDESST